MFGERRGGIWEGAGPPPLQSPPRAAQPASRAGPQPRAQPRAPPVQPRPWVHPLHLCRSVDARRSPRGPRTPGLGRQQVAERLETDGKRSGGLGPPSLGGQGLPRPCASPRSFEAVKRRARKNLELSRGPGSQPGARVGRPPPSQAPLLWRDALCRVRSAPALRLRLESAYSFPPTNCINLESSKESNKFTISK